MMNKILIIAGSLLIIAGVFWKQIIKLPFFKLPGDIIIDKPGFKIYFPVVTLLIISMIISLIIWIFKK